MTVPLTNKRAVVTGATRGIGHAIAARLHADGAEVIGTGTRVDGASPPGCNYCVVDFADPEQMCSFFKTVEEFAPDILVNNSGINKIGPFVELRADDFEKIQRVNVYAPFQLCQAVIPVMQTRGWGRIVNIGSIWGRISKAGRGSYSASKFALDGMTAALAAEVAADGILANCIAPGFIDTELTRTILGEEQMEELRQQVPIRRFGTPEEIASFVAWLASPENTYISGQNIAIDGGFTRV